MRFPAYILLPIFGAVTLVAAVLGSWLWPAPTVSSVSVAPPSLPAPAAMETPPAPPEPMPAPSRPVARPVPAPTRPIQPVERPPSPVVMPPPTAMVRPPPPPPPPPPPSWPAAGAITPPQLTDLSPEAREQLRQKWKSLPDRVGDMALKGMEHMERQRDEARARGDQVEFERLDAIINQNREQLEKMRAMRQALPPAPQAGPPMQ